MPRGLSSIDDAKALLALHRGASAHDPVWRDWLVETMAAYFVHGARTHGRIDTGKATDIITLFSVGGTITDATELEAVLHMIELADDCCDELVAFALEQLHLAITKGKGAHASARVSKRRGIAAEDLDFVHRILRRSNWSGRVALTALEASIIDNIDEAVSGQFNHPGWRNLMCSIVRQDEEVQTGCGAWLCIHASAAHIASFR